MAIKRGKLVAGLLGLALAAVGCGSSGPTSSPTTTSASSSKTTAAPSPNLTSQLLTISDMPPGWSVDNSPESSNSSTPECLKSVTKSPAQSKASAKFKMGANGVPAFQEGLSYLPGGQAEKRLTEFNKVLSGCKDVSFTSDGQTYTGSVGAMSFPPQGDKSYAFQLNFSTSSSGLDLTVGLDIVVAQKNSTDALFDIVDLGTPDLTTFTDLVTKGMAKVK